MARLPFAKSGTGVVLLICLLFIAPQLSCAGSSPTKGSLLIASADMADPRFQHAVILLLQHGQEGTVGLIINKPLPLAIGHAVPGLPEEIFGEQPLYYGGPVLPNTAWALFSGVQRPEDTVAILPGVFVANADRLISGESLSVEAGRLKILVGYAGWAPGQLEKEIARGDWKVTPARAAEIFDADPESLWQYLSGQGAVFI